MGSEAATGDRPLENWNVVVTRSADQASPLVERLHELGAQATQVPLIRIATPADGGQALRSALARPAAWLVVTSPNGARACLGASDTNDRPERQIACVGPATAAVFARAGVSVTLIPQRSVGESLVDAFPSAPKAGGTVVLAQAAQARPIVGDGIAALGWDVHQVTAYRTVDADVDPAAIVEIGEAHAILFTSSSTVERFVRLIGRVHMPPVVITIGPITSATAENLGVQVTGQASRFDLDGLVDALCRHARQHDFDNGRNGSSS